MNNNANLVEPSLVADLSRSVVARIERPDVQLLIDAIGELMPPSWARELAATVVCHLEAGADFETALGEVIQRRMLHPDTYYGWKDIGLAQAIRIYAAMRTAWSKR